MITSKNKAGREAFKASPRWHRSVSAPAHGDFASRRAPINPRDSRNKDTPGIPRYHLDLWKLCHQVRRDPRCEAAGPHSPPAFLESRLLSPPQICGSNILIGGEKKKKKACHTGLSIWLKTDITAAWVPPYLRLRLRRGEGRMRMETDSHFSRGKRKQCLSISIQRGGKAWSVVLYPFIHMWGRAQTSTVGRLRL